MTTKKSKREPKQDFGVEGCSCPRCWEDAVPGTDKCKECTRVKCDLVGLSICAKGGRFIGPSGECC